MCDVSRRRHTCMLFTAHLDLTDVAGREKGRQSKHGGHDTFAPHSMPPCCHSRTYLTGKGETLLCNLAFTFTSTDVSPNCLCSEFFSVVDKCHILQEFLRNNPLTVWLVNDRVSDFSLLKMWMVGWLRERVVGFRGSSAYVHVCVRACVLYASVEINYSCCQPHHLQ